MARYLTLENTKKWDFYPLTKKIQSKKSDDIYNKYNKTSYNIKIIKKNLMNYYAC